MSSAKPNMSPPTGLKILSWWRCYKYFAPTELPVQVSTVLLGLTDSDWNRFPVRQEHPFCLFDFDLVLPPGQTFQRLDQP